MSGKYAGLQALIKHDAPNSTFTHCYAHRFNLSMTDATTCCLEAKKTVWIDRIDSSFHEKLLQTNECVERIC